MSEIGDILRSLDGKQVEVHATLSDGRVWIVRSDLRDRSGPNGYGWAVFDWDRDRSAIFSESNVVRIELGKPYFLGLLKTEPIIHTRPPYSAVTSGFPATLTLRGEVCGGEEEQ